MGSGDDILVPEEFRLLGEIWKPVPIEPFGEVYFVSSFGRAFSKRRSGNWEDRIMALGKNARGYPQIHMMYKGMKTTQRIHRMICWVFHDAPPNDDSKACHRDDNNTNNVPDNLYWGSGIDNMQDRIRNGNNPNGVKTHCKNGHEYNEKNTYYYKNGRRGCRPCGAAFAKKYRDEAKQ